MPQRRRCSTTSGSVVLAIRHRSAEPWPGPPVTIGLRVDESCCDRPGKASYSASTPMIGEPLPQLATKTVGIWPMLRSRANPAASSSSASNRHAKRSSSAISGCSQNLARQVAKLLVLAVFILHKLIQRHGHSDDNASHWRSACSSTVSQSYHHAATSSAA